MTKRFREHDPRLSLPPRRRCSIPSPKGRARQSPTSITCCLAAPNWRKSPRRLVSLPLWHGVFLRACRNWPSWWSRSIGMPSTNGRSMSTSPQGGGAGDRHRGSGNAANAGVRGCGRRTRLSLRQHLFRHNDVPDDLFAAAQARFGEKAVVELAGLLGYYSMLAICLRIYRVPPQGEA